MIQPSTTEGANMLWFYLSVVSIAVCFIRAVVYHDLYLALPVIPVALVLYLIRVWKQLWTIRALRTAIDSEVIGLVSVYQVMAWDIIRRMMWMMSQDEWVDSEDEDRLHFTLVRLSDRWEEEVAPGGDRGDPWLAEEYKHQETSRKMKRDLEDQMRSCVLKWKRRVEP